MKVRPLSQTFLDPFSKLPTALVNLLLIASVLTVGALGFAGIQSLDTLNRGTDLAAATQGGRYQLSRVLQLLVEMGSGTRRFEASQDATVFNEARAAAAQLPAAMTELQQFLADDSGQIAPLRHLQELAEKRRRQTQQVQNLAITRGVDAMNAALASGEGTKIIDDSRTVVTAMQAHQVQRWDEQRRVSRTARLTVAAVIIASAGIGALLILLTAYTSARDGKRLRRAQAALLQANATLEKQVAERTAALLESETLTRTFFEHSSECHAILSQVGERFQYDEVNPETLRLYGKTREAVIGRTLEEVLGPFAGRALTVQMIAGLATDAPFRYEREHPQGYLEAVATPIPQGIGNGRRIVISARDVTERRRLEQQLQQSQKMEAVGQLTGGLAHDFNNLLTAIGGSLELIETRVAQGRFENLDRYMAAAKGGAKRAAALTHRLLAFSRRQTLDAKPTDVNRLVADMVELIRRTVGPAITVDVVGATGLWQPLVDANQLENALLNLCINARDAMPDGGKIIIETANRWLDPRMARERELPPGSYISLCVSDTGCGMPAEVIARAFDPFYTTKPLGEGTGLGLSMIYGFARQSGGQAKIYSEVGEGARVCLYLPRYHGDPAVEPPEDEKPTPILAQCHQVLVVDDEPSVRMLVAEVVQDLGCHYLECHDGVSALKVLESPQTVDLLVTDVGLPNGMNGRQLADFARVLRPKLKVLFITGYAENAVFSHGQVELGFEVLTKPFSMQELGARISALIEKK